MRLKGGTLAKRGHRDGISTDCPGDIVYDWVLDGMPAATAMVGLLTIPTTEDDDVTPQDKKDIIDGVWAKLLARPGNTPITAGGRVGAANVNAFRALRRVTALDAKVVALTAAVEALASATPAGGADVGGIVDRAVRDRLATMPLDVEEEAEL